VRPISRLMASGGGGAAFSANFVSNPTLPQGATFSRGTVATQYNSSGLLQYAPSNLLLQSQALNLSPWITQPNVTLTSTNTGVAPDGTLTASLWTFSGTSNNSIYQSYNTAVNQTLTGSVYLKGQAGQTISVSWQPFSGSAVFTVWTLTGNWDRVSATATNGATAGSGNFAISVTAGQTATAVYVWGAQLEASPTATTYTPTTTAAVYGPRFDYDPTNASPKGLLIEEGRTNSLLQSNTFTTTWVTTNATVTANSVVSPDGSVNASTIVPTTSTNSHLIGQSIAVTAGSWNVSFYLKSDGYTKIGIREDAITGASVAVDLSIGATLYTTGTNTTSVTSVGNGWYRVSMNYTVSANASHTYSIYVLPASYTTGSFYGINWAGDGASGVYVYGAQAEAGGFVTSYIPTTTTAATRNNESLTIASIPWYSSTAGSVVIQFDTNGIQSTEAIYPGIFSFNNGTSTVRIGQFVAYNNGISTLQQGTAGPSVAATGNTLLDNTVYKTASTWTVGNQSLCVSAGTVYSVANASLPAATQLYLGQFDNPLNGHIRSFAYYKTAFTNAQLQSVTT